jgi:hypothetical protein
MGGLMSASLRLGDSGSDVGALQQELVEATYAIASDELAAGSFGLSTESAVRALQKAHGLLCDGIAGPATMHALGQGSPRYTAPNWRYTANDVPAAARPATDYAVSQIGRFEVPNGSNKIPGDPYRNGSAPWCAYFVSACYLRVDGGSPFGVLASALKIHDWATAKGRVLAADAPPLPGDVFVILRAGGHGHTGLVAALEPGGALLCVEGNAGNAVRGTRRMRDAFACLIRPLVLS